MILEVTLCAGAEGAPQLHSVADPAEQIAPFSQHKSVVAVENKAGEIAGLLVAHWIVFPAVAAVTADKEGAVAAPAQTAPSSSQARSM